MVRIGTRGVWLFAPVPTRTEICRDVYDRTGGPSLWRAEIKILASPVESVLSRLAPMMKMNGPLGAWAFSVACQPP